MTILPFAAALAMALGQNDVPRSLGQAEAPPPRPQELTAPPQAEGQGHDVFSFGRVQASARIGFAAYSEDFESDPQFLGGLAARVDWPWMSRDVFGFDTDRIGLYADLSVTSIERDLDFLRYKDGTVVLVGFGADVNLYEDETCVFRGQAGGQYGYFDNVDDTDDGVAGVLGIDLGLKLAEDMAIVLNPQFVFGNAGDQVYLVSAGLQIRF